MLCIIFGEIPEDMEKKYVYNTSMYFDNTYLDNWLTDDLSVKMIKSVDKAVVLSPNAVDSKALGVIPVTKISGGRKRFCFCGTMIQRFSMPRPAVTTVQNGYCA